MEKTHGVPDTGMPTVPLATAQEQTANWRTFIAQQGFAEKAFYIRKEDLIEALQLPAVQIPANSEISGIRVYLALEDMENQAQRCHLYVVATDANQNDIVHDQQMNSLVYDTTIPCPAFCSQANILTGLPAQEAAGDVA